MHVFKIEVKIFSDVSTGGSGNINVMSIAIKYGPKKITIFLRTYAQVCSFLTYRIIEDVH